MKKLKFLDVDKIRSFFADLLARVFNRDQQKTALVVTVPMNSKGVEVLFYKDEIGQSWRLMILDKNGKAFYPCFAISKNGLATWKKMLSLADRTTQRFERNEATITVTQSNDKVTMGIKAKLAQHENVRVVLDSFNQKEFVKAIKAAM